MAFVPAKGLKGSKFCRFRIRLRVSILRNRVENRSREKGQEICAFRLKMPHFIDEFNE